MKTPTLRPLRGVALMIALALLVLLSVLVLAFLSNVRTDRASAASYGAGTSTRLLAESVVHLVQGQIQDATDERDQAWVSQPGLIRTFNSAGNPSGAYKLYSSPILTVTGAFDPAAPANGDLPPANWRTTPNQWADLNEPVEIDGVLNFPIVDAKNLTAAGIIDADNDNQADVEGFEITSTAFLQPGQGLDMPVQWLYVLEDGQIVPATPGVGKNVNVPAATKANPIVGRVAFWTDDESTKLNINTAGEAVFWDAPVALSNKGGANGIWRNAGGNLQYNSAYDPDPNQPYEADFAAFQGATHEYQRYPGHPATVCISPVFYRSLASRLGYNLAGGQTYLSSFPQHAAVMEALYALTPRYPWEDTSKAGTVRFYDVASATPKSERLYASSDELLYKPSRNEQPLTSSAQETPELVDRLSFFLTAQSKAPEVTLFNTPRVAIWPVDDSSSKRTAFDNAMAFASSVGPQGTEVPYYITRSQPRNGTTDWNTGNRRIYSYLQSLTSSPVPGYGGRFSGGGKWGSDGSDQILTQIVDFIRCVNLADPSQSASNRFTQSPGIGQVVPLDPGNGTRGFGRIAMVSEIAVCLTRLPNNEIEVALLPELFSPMAGYVALENNLTVEFENLGNLQVNNQTPFTMGSHSMETQPYTATQAVPRIRRDSRYGGYIGFQSLIHGSSLPPLGKVSAPGATSTQIPLATNGSIRVIVREKSSNVVVQSFGFSFPPTQVPVPTMPSSANHGRSYSGAQSTSNTTPWKLDNNREPQNWFEDGSYRDVVRSVVAAFGAVETRGDFRLAAAVSDPGRFYGVSSGLYNGTEFLVHHLMTTYEANQLRGQRLGGLVAGVDYGRLNPKIPQGINPSPGPMGDWDWDNGPGLVKDGPFLNKPDEGAPASHSGGQVNFLPYIGRREALAYTPPAPTGLFSPNRQIPSPVAFGSLPVGVKSDVPWRTLLFRPATSYFPGGANRSGTETPPDHVLLDFFWMPVVEPYPISERFATAGKINLNQQIAPFTYIRRETGLHGVLRATRVTAIDPDDSPEGVKFSTVYKEAPGFTGGTANELAVNSRAREVLLRHQIDESKTIEFIRERWTTQNRPFVSASEITTIPFIPKGEDRSSLAIFWSKHKLTGDNSLEKPYNAIYSLLTTRSNTYLVHVRVQSLKKLPTTPAGEFVDGRDTVEGEFRGSFLIERYLDPNTQEFDESGFRSGAPDAILGPYRFRTLQSKRFGS